MTESVNVAALEAEIDKTAAHSPHLHDFLMEELKVAAAELPGADDLPRFEDIPIPTEPVSQSLPLPALPEPGDLSGILDYLRAAAYLPYYWEFSGGPLKRFAKRLVRKLCKCLLPPIMDRQSSWNAESTNVLTYLYEHETLTENAARQSLSELGTLREAFDQTVEALSSRISDLEQDRVLLRKELIDERKRADQAESALKQLSESDETLIRRMESTDHSVFPRLSALEALTDTQSDNLSAESARVADLERRTGDLERGCDARLSELEARAAAAEERAGQMETRAGSIEQAVGGIHEKVQLLDRESDAISAAASRLLLDARRAKAGAREAASFAAASSAEETCAPAERNNSYESVNYFSFENQFRGTRSLIMQRQQIYVKYFEGAKRPVLDLGCGRGEFLRLLKDADIPAYGVDLYEEFVAEGELNGVDVRLGEAIAYLKNSAERFGGIFAGQLIEHLSFAQLRTLLEESFRVLDDGAVLILETPNPMCLSVFANSFYLDPTHDKPVHPLMLQALIKEIGFKEAEIVFTECSRLPALPQLKCEGAENLEEFNAGVQRVSELLFGSQDYAIIARK